MNLKTHGVTLITAAALLMPTAMHAQGRHPRYISARTDLRTAQLLARVQEQPNVALNLQAAAREMDAAVKEIDRAAVLDLRRFGGLSYRLAVSLGIPSESK